MIPGWQRDSIQIPRLQYDPMYKILDSVCFTFAWVLVLVARVTECPSAAVQCVCTLRVTWLVKGNSNIMTVTHHYITINLTQYTTRPSGQSVNEGTILSYCPIQARVTTIIIKLVIKGKKSGKELSCYTLQTTVTSYIFIIQQFFSFVLNQIDDVAINDNVLEVRQLYYESINGVKTKTMW